MSVSVFYPLLDSEQAGSFGAFTPVGTTDHGTAVLTDSDGKYLVAVAQGNRDTWCFSNTSGHTNPAYDGVVPIDATIDRVVLKTTPTFFSRQLLVRLADVYERTFGTINTGYEDLVIAADGSSDGYSALLTNPFTAIAWTTAEIFNLVEFGIKCTRPEDPTTENIEYASLIIWWSVGGITITPTTLPDGTVGQEYSQQLTGHGGDGGPYTFAVVAGALPDGLTLSSNGLLST